MGSWKGNVIIRNPKREMFLCKRYSLSPNPPAEDTRCVKVQGTVEALRKALGRVWGFNFETVGQQFTFLLSP